MQSCKFGRSNKFLLVKVAVQEFLLSKGLLLERLSADIDYEIDAFQLFMLVEEHGGFEEITDQGLWKEIGLITITDPEPNCGIVCYEFYKSTFLKMQKQLIKAGILNSEGSINYDVQLQPLTYQPDHNIKQQTNVLRKKRELESKNQLDNQNSNSQGQDSIKKRRLQKPKDENMDVQDVFGASSQDDMPQVVKSKSKSQTQKSQPIRNIDQTDDVKLVFGGSSDDETNAKTNKPEVVGNSTKSKAPVQNVQDVFGASTDDDEQVRNQKQQNKGKQSVHSQNALDVFGVSTDDEQQLSKQTNLTKKNIDKMDKKLVGNKRKRLAAVQEVANEQNDMKDVFGESSDDDANNQPQNSQKPSNQTLKKGVQINFQVSKEKNLQLEQKSNKQFEVDDVFGASSQQESENELQQKQKIKAQNISLKKSLEKNVSQKKDLEEVFGVSEEEQKKEKTDMQKQQNQKQQQQCSEQYTSSDGFKSPRNSKKKQQKSGKINKNSQIFALTKAFQQQQDCKKTKMQKRRVKQKTSQPESKNSNTQTSDQNEKRVINIDKNKFKQKTSNPETSLKDMMDEVLNIFGMSSQDERENEKNTNFSDLNQLDNQSKKATKKEKLGVQKTEIVSPQDIFGISSQDEQQSSDVNNCPRKLQRAGKIGASILQQPDKCEIDDVFGVSSEDEEKNLNRSKDLKKLGKQRKKIAKEPPPMFSQEGQPPLQSNIGDVFGVSSQEEQEDQSRVKRRKQPTKKQRIQKVQQWQIPLDDENVQNPIHSSQSSKPKKFPSSKKESKAPICKKQVKEEIFGVSSQDEGQTEKTPNMEACEVFGFSSQDEGVHVADPIQIQNNSTKKQSLKQQDFFQHSKIKTLDYNNQSEFNENQQQFQLESGKNQLSDDDCALTHRKSRLNSNLQKKEIKLLRRKEAMKNFLEEENDDINLKIVSNFMVDNSEHLENAEIQSSKDLDLDSNLISKIQTVNDHTNPDDNEVLDQIIQNVDYDDKNQNDDNQLDENPSILPSSVKDFIQKQIHNNQMFENINQNNDINKDKSSKLLPTDNPNGRCCISIQVPRSLRFPSRSQVAAVARKFGTLQWIDYGYTKHRIYVTFTDEIIARGAITKIVPSMERFLNLEEGTLRSAQIYPPDLKDRFKQKKDQSDQWYHDSDVRDTRDRDGERERYRERKSHQSVRTTQNEPQPSEPNLKSSKSDKKSPPRPILTIHPDQIREAPPQPYFQPPVSPELTPPSVHPTPSPTPSLQTPNFPTPPTLNQQPPVLPAAAPGPVPVPTQVLPPQQQIFVNPQNIYPQFQPPAQPLPLPLPPLQIQNYPQLQPQIHPQPLYQQQPQFQPQPPFQSPQMYSNNFSLGFNQQYQTNTVLQSNYNINNQQPGNTGIQQLNNNQFQQGYQQQQQQQSQQNLATQIKNATGVPSFDTNALLQLQQSLQKINKNNNNNAVPASNPDQPAINQLPLDTVVGQQQIPVSVQQQVQDSQLQEGQGTSDAVKKQEGGIFDNGGYTTIEQMGLSSKGVDEQKIVCDDFGGIPGLGGDEEDDEEKEWMEEKEGKKQAEGVQEGVDIQVEKQKAATESTLIDEIPEPVQQINNDLSSKNASFIKNELVGNDNQEQLKFQTNHNQSSIQQQKIDENISTDVNIKSDSPDSQQKAKADMDVNQQICNMDQFQQQTVGNYEGVTKTLNTNASDDKNVVGEQIVEEVKNQESTKQEEDGVGAEDVMDKLAAPPSSMLRNILSSVDKKSEEETEQKSKSSELQKNQPSQGEDTQQQSKNQQSSKREELPEPPKPAEVKSKLMALFGQL